MNQPVLDAQAEQHHLEGLGPHLEVHGAQGVELCWLAFLHGQFEVLPSLGVVPVALAHWVPPYWYC